MKLGEKIIIVGGVAGGASAAARLRRLSEKHEIIMFERGDYISFANCGLPYYIGGEITDKEVLTLQTPESFHARFQVDVRVANEVIDIDSDNKEVSVKNLKTNEIYKESYDKLILSMGAEPIKPNLPGIDSKKVFTLRNIPDTYAIREYIEEQKPKHAVVVGGGYIGVEMAENLKLAGVDVTLVEMSNQVIAPLDYDMACEVHSHMKSKGVTLMLESAVKEIREEAESLFVKVEGKETKEIQADMLIMSVGVKPETNIAKEAGIEVNERGSIVVNETMLTSKDDIYAVGDAVEVVNFVTGEKTFIPLAGPANKQGRIAADNICGIHSKYKGTQGSSILKVFDMTVATTGINEKIAKTVGYNYEKSFSYSPNHASYYKGAVNMSIKIIFEKENGKILGAQIVGFDGVDKRCDVLATAIRAGLTAYDLTDLELCYAPPYSSAKDPVNMAGFVIQNILTGLEKIYHWHDVEHLPKDGSVTLLDTRTKMEYENGHIEGFNNIPLDELRGRLDELDLTKTIYVTCQIGLRGYVAARILMENGFDVYNLSGGYRLYRSIFPDKIVTPKENRKNRIIINTEVQRVEKVEEKKEEKEDKKRISVNACGLQCPGPIVKLSEALSGAEVGDVVEITTTDPSFGADIEGYCRRTGNVLEEISSEKGNLVANIRKAMVDQDNPITNAGNGKNIIVFSGDLDKAIASFIIANAAGAMGRHVSMFFTFWGLNILRKPEKVKVKKDMISKMFGAMMSRGSKKLKLSKMNMAGMGAKMIRGVMKDKNVNSLEDLIKLAQSNGVELIACSMSMDVMGIKKEELIDGVKLAGAAAMIANAEESDMSLFI